MTNTSKTIIRTAAPKSAEETRIEHQMDVTGAELAVLLDRATRYVRSDDKTGKRYEVVNVSAQFSRAMEGGAFTRIMVEPYEVQEQAGKTVHLLYPSESLSGVKFVEQFEPCDASAAEVKAWKAEFADVVAREKPIEAGNEQAIKDHVAKITALPKFQVASPAAP